MNKFSILLNTIVESGLIGSNFGITEFAIKPIAPRNLKDLANYLIMIHQLIYAQRNGLQNYTKEKLRVKLIWNGKTIKYDSQRKAIESNKNSIIFLNFLNFISQLFSDNKNENTLQKIKMFTNNKNNFNFFKLDNNFFINEITKKFKIKIFIANTISKSKYKKPVFVEINPLNKIFSDEWSARVLHELFHIVIDPNSVSKFSNRNYGDFQSPVGYSHDELLQEVPALITDFHKKYFEKPIQSKKDTRYKLNQKPIDYVEVSPTIFPFFLNILRNTIIANYLETLSKEEKKEFNKNPISNLKKIKLEDKKVKFEDILRHFSNYPDFQRILIKLQKMLRSKQNKVEELNQIKNFKDEEQEYDIRALRTKYNNGISKLKNDDNFSTFIFPGSLSLAEDDLQKYESIYEPIDRILYSLMQKSHTFLRKKDEKVGVSEIRITNFSNHINDIIKRYNKSISLFSDMTKLN
jgi:hypothetical protein